jgi:PAS domain-containing protein
MFPKAIEVILARHLASCLAMPIFIVDEDGSLVFYNEPSEPILGKRFEEAGEINSDEWSKILLSTDLNGVEIPYEERPVVIALMKQQPSSREMILTGFDNVPHHISVTAIPIIGQADRFLGAIAIFWEIEAENG